MEPSVQYIGSLDAWRQEIATDAERSAHVPVDADGRLLKFLHLSLAGTPRSSGRRPLVVRVWTSSTTALGAMSAYFMLLAGAASDLPTFWRTYASAAAFMLFAGYLCISECTWIMAQSMPQPGVSSLLSQGLTGGRDGDRPTFTKEKEEFVRLLLATRVSATCAAEVRGWLMKSYVNVFPCCSILWYLLSAVSLGIPEFSGDEMSFAGRAAWVVYVVCTVPTTMILSGWLLYMHVPCIIVHERIRQMMTAVRDMKGDTRNFNVVMSMVQDAHESTLRLSALLTPTMAVNAGLSGCVTSFLVVLSVFSRPDCHRRFQVQQPLGCGEAEVGVTNLTAPHAWQDINFLPAPPWVYTAMAVAFFINCLIPFLSAASTTAAVDELMHAVGALRYEHQSNGVARTGSNNAAGAQQLRPLMTLPENLIRVDGLQQYAAELNGGQGIGFTFFKMRIDKTLVVGLMLRGLFLIGMFIACVNTVLTMT